MRLDKAVYLRKLAQSRSRAEMLIVSGAVKVNGTVVTKPSKEVEETDVILAEDIGYVGRGGLKLEHAIDTFLTKVNGRVFADIGASTGGFTQCLLKKGAKHVYSIDVGHGQLAEEIRKDGRVTVMEDTNARELNREMFEHCIEGCVMDVSFISQTALYDSIFSLTDGELISLIKPQFEAGKQYLNKKGIIKNKNVYGMVLKRIESSANIYGRRIEKICVSPILGGDGNKEFLALITKGESIIDIEKFLKDDFLCK